jgi:hypothetical protein
MMQDQAETIVRVGNVKDGQVYETGSFKPEEARLKLSIEILLPEQCPKSLGTFHFCVDVKKKAVVETARGKWVYLSIVFD